MSIQKTHRESLSRGASLSWRAPSGSQVPGTIGIVINSVREARTARARPTGAPS